MSRKDKPTKVPPLNENGTFDIEMKRRIAAVDEAITLLGTSMSEVCREAKVARSTPDRWRKATPKSVQSLADIEHVLAVKLAKARELGVIPPLQR